jgi:hypothetical protein
VLTTGGDDAVLAYLKAAREHHTQAKIADFLKTTPRTAYSGERDRSFRSNVTAAHQVVLRG